MIDLIKTRLKIRLPKDFVVGMDRGRVFYSPFPSHGWDVRSKSYCIHDICTHEKMGHSLSSSFTVFSRGYDLGINIIRKDSCAIHYVRKLMCIRIPKQPTHHTNSIKM